MSHLLIPASPEEDNDVDTRPTIAALELAQLRALVDVLTDADPETVIALALADDGLRVRVDPADRDQPRRWLMVTYDAAVLPALAHADQR